MISRPAHATAKTITERGDACAVVGVDNASMTANVTLRITALSPAAGTILDSTTMCSSDLHLHRILCYEQRCASPTTSRKHTNLTGDARIASKVQTYPLPTCKRCYWRTTIYSKSQMSSATGVERSMSLLLTLRSARHTYRGFSARA
jgi:hypothetical protein